MISNANGFMGRATTMTATQKALCALMYCVLSVIFARQACAQLMETLSPQNKLAYAITTGDTAMATAAISAGADVNLIDVTTKMVPLFQAVALNDSAMTTLLISKGANLFYTLSDGTDALEIAYSSNFPAIAALIAKEVELRRPGTLLKVYPVVGVNMTLLNYAQGNDSTSLLLPIKDALIANQAPLESLQMAINNAIAKNQKVFLQTLLGYLATSPLKTDPSSKLTIVQASFTLPKQETQALVLNYFAGTDATQRQALIESADSNNMRLLHSAVAQGSFTRVSQLVGYGASRSARTTFESETPIHVAVRMGDEAALKLMIANFATVKTIKSVSEELGQANPTAYCQTLLKDAKATCLMYEFKESSSCNTSGLKTPVPCPENLSGSWTNEGCTPKAAVNFGLTSLEGKPRRIYCGLASVANQYPFKLIDHIDGGGSLNADHFCQERGLTCQAVNWWKKDGCEAVSPGSRLCTALVLDAQFEAGPCRTATSAGNYADPAQLQSSLFDTVPRKIICVPRKSGAYVDKVVLVNAATDIDVRDLSHSVTISLSDLPSLSFRTVISGGATAVEYIVNGKSMGLQTAAPYAIAGAANSGKDILPFSLSPGIYSIEVRAYTDPNNAATASTSFWIHGLEITP